MRGPMVTAKRYAAALMKTNFDAIGIRVKSQINIFSSADPSAFNRLSITRSLPTRPLGTRKLRGMHGETSDRSIKCKLRRSRVNFYHMSRELTRQRECEYFDIQNALLAVLPFRPEYIAE